MGLFDIQKMRKLREDAKLTQEQAAKLAGFSSRQAWNNIESGRRDPTLETLEKIAKALKVKPARLFK